MYADDIVLLADYPVKLRHMIRSLEKYCDTWNLTVNLSKSKILVFREGGIVPPSLHFYYKSNPIECVESYCYLGILLTPRLAWTENLKIRTNRAKWGINSVWHNFLNNSKISLVSKFKIYEAVMRSIQLYGAQIWGFGNFETVDKLQRYFIKRVLKLPTNTPNYILNLELGIDDSHFFSLKLHMNYIFRTIFKLNEDRLPNFFSKLILRKNIFWAKQWNEMGREFGLSWSASSMEFDLWKLNEKNLLEKLIKKQQDINVSNMQSSQRIYKELHTQNTASYLQPGNDVNFISWIFKTRSDNLGLNSVSYRTENQQKCSLCNLNENVEHFIARCPILKEFRLKHFSKQTLSHSELVSILSSQSETVSLNDLYEYLKEAFFYRKVLISEFNY